MAFIIKDKKKFKETMPFIITMKSKIPERNPSKKAKDLWSGIYKIPRKKKSQMTQTDGETCQALRRKESLL